MANAFTDVTHTEVWTATSHIDLGIWHKGITIRRTSLRNEDEWFLKRLPRPEVDHQIEITNQNNKFTQRESSENTAKDLVAI